MRTAVLTCVMFALPLAGEPRKSARDYPAHVETAAAEIGVDYLVHSYAAEGQMYFTKDYLVFEVAVYPRMPMELGPGSFQLRINNAKRLIQPASAEFVAASLRNPDWVQRPHAELGAGVGDTGVVLGAPPAVGRFPGDPTGGARYPRPPRAPEDPHKPEKPVQDGAQVALDTALQTGRIMRPVSGNIYFEYSGNIKKLKTLSLIFHTADGDQEIPIR
jgi:hypothetical protein